MAEELQKAKAECDKALLEQTALNETINQLTQSSKENDEKTQGLL
jgi:hypothetical protein